MTGPFGKEMKLNANDKMLLGKRLTCLLAGCLFGFLWLDCQAVAGWQTGPENSQENSQPDELSRIREDLQATFRACFRHRFWYRSQLSPQAILALDESHRLAGLPVRDRSRPEYSAPHGPSLVELGRDAGEIHIILDSSIPDPSLPEGWRVGYSEHFLSGDTWIRYSDPLLPGTHPEFQAELGVANSHASSVLRPDLALMIGRLKVPDRPDLFLDLLEDPGVWEKAAWKPVDSRRGVVEWTREVKALGKGPDAPRGTDRDFRLLVRLFVEKAEFGWRIGALEFVRIGVGEDARQPPQMIGKADSFRYVDGDRRFRGFTKYGSSLFPMGEMTKESELELFDFEPIEQEVMAPFHFQASTARMIKNPVVRILGQETVRYELRDGRIVKVIDDDVNNPIKELSATRPGKPTAPDLAITDTQAEATRPPAQQTEVARGTYLRSSSSQHCGVHSAAIVAASLGREPSLAEVVQPK